MLTWTLIVQLLTGEVIAIDQASEEECEKNLALSKMRGQVMTVEVRGTRTPVSRTYGCAMRRIKAGEAATS